MAETPATSKTRACKRAKSKPAFEPEVTTIVVKFPRAADAERAFRVLNKALRDKGKTIYQGAVVSRKDDGELRVKDIREVGLGRIIVDAAGTTISIGLGGLGLLRDVAAASLSVLLDTARLAKNSAGQVVGLAGETLAYPGHKLLDRCETRPEIVKASQDLAPGETAIVVTADAKTALDLAAGFTDGGGKVV